MSAMATLKICWSKTVHKDACLSILKVMYFVHNLVGNRWASQARPKGKCVTHTVSFLVDCTDSKDLIWQISKRHPWVFYLQNVKHKNLVDMLLEGFMILPYQHFNVSLKRS